MSNVPKLRFKEFSGEWEEKKLGNLVDIKSGISPSAYNLTESGTYPFLKVEDLNNCDKYQIISRQYSEDIKNLIPRSSVIFPKRGAAILLNKVRVNLSEVLMDSNLMAITPNKNISVEFLYYKIIKDELFRIADTSTIPQINNKHIIPYKVTIPSKQEQEKIASFLTSVDTKIEQLTRKEELLQQYKKGVMQKIFSQEIRFKADDGSEFCDWEEKKFEDYLEMPINLKPKNAEKDKLLTVKLHQKGIYKSENTDSLSMGATYYIREKGQFIYGKQNLFNGAFGIIPQEFDNYLTSTDVPTLNFKINRINPNYFLFFIGRKEYYTKLEIFASGTGSKRIHEKTLLDFKAFFPCLEEQTKISNFLSSIDIKIEQVQKQLNSIKEFKKALLQQMFV